MNKQAYILDQLNKIFVEIRAAKKIEESEEVTRDEFYALVSVMAKRQIGLKKEIDALKLAQSTKKDSPPLNDITVSIRVYNALKAYVSRSDDRTPFKTYGEHTLVDLVNLGLTVRSLGLIRNMGKTGILEVEKLYKQYEIHLPS